MDTRRSFVTFACARVRTAPSDGTAVHKQFEIERQRAVMKLATPPQRFRLVAHYADVSTTAGTLFLTRPMFLRAVDRARSERAMLLIDDIGSIVRHLDRDGARHAITSIKALDIDVVEASTFASVRAANPKLLLT